MSKNKVKRDRQFPFFVHTIPFRRLFDNPKKFCHYVTNGQVVADLGCGAGYYTFALAECVGPKGKVYAVELNEKAIRILEKKSNKSGYHNIKAYASSAADINFIKERSVDFILANGLLCAMAPQHHESAVNEMIRILKPNGKAFIRADGGLGSYMSKAGWEKILERFRIERRSDVHTRFDNWAVVSKKLVNQ